VTCPLGTTNVAGDDVSEADTSCDVTYCLEDESVTGNTCVACPLGTTNGAGDDASGADTQCEVTYCLEDEYVLSNVCTDCPPGMVNPLDMLGDDDDSAAGDDDDSAAGDDDDSAAGAWDDLGDDASGPDTTCDVWYCATDEHVVGNACVACGPGTVNSADDDATGGDTSCDVTYCATHEHVVGNTCVACGPGTGNSAGDDASGGDTSCDVAAVAVGSSTTTSFSGDDRIRGNGFEAVGGHTITSFDLRLDIASTTSCLIDAYIFSNTLWGASGWTIEASTLDIAVGTTGEQWVNSGPMNVNTQAGNVYVLAIGWTDCGSVGYTTGLPNDFTPLGTMTGTLWVPYSGSLADPNSLDYRGTSTSSRAYEMRVF